MFWWEMIGITEWHIIILITTAVCILIYLISNRLKENNYWKTLNNNQKRYLVLAYISGSIVHILIVMNFSVIWMIILIEIAVNIIGIENIMGTSILIIGTLILILFHFNFMNIINKYMTYSLDIWNESLKTIGVNMNMKFDEGDTLDG